jgi:hypothetical protein
MTKIYFPPYIKQLESKSNEAGLLIRSQLQYNLYAN